jgi:acetyl-CoA acetyltransferase
VTERKPPGDVEKATRSELRRLRCSVRTDGMAALAVSLAQQIDTARGAVAAAAAAGQLRLILADLTKSSEKRSPQKDAIDELNARRAVKRAG